MRESVSSDWTDVFVHPLKLHAAVVVSLTRSATSTVLFQARARVKFERDGAVTSFGPGPTQ
jgi:hypothetical protein